MQERKIRSAECKALRYIRTYYHENKSFPMNKEIGAHFGLVKSGISMIVKTLENQGYISREENAIVSINDAKVTETLQKDLESQLDSLFIMMSDCGIKKIDSNGNISFSKEYFELQFPGRTEKSIKSTNKKYTFRIEEKRAQKPPAEKKPTSEKEKEPISEKKEKQPAKKEKKFSLKNLLKRK